MPNTAIPHFIAFHFIALHRHCVFVFLFFLQIEGKILHQQKDYSSQKPHMMVSIFKQ